MQQRQIDHFVSRLTVKPWHWLRPRPDWRDYEQHVCSGSVNDTVVAIECPGVAAALYALPAPALIITVNDYFTLGARSRTWRNLKISNLVTIRLFAQTNFLVSAERLPGLNWLEDTLTIDKASASFKRRPTE
ncbi:hypothetical protein RHS03_08561, partial [Rhizoctonia solani]